MKHYWISIFICFSSFYSNAQITHHFPHENATWGQFDGVYFDNPFGADYYMGGTHYYTPVGDSLLDGKTYIKIYDTDSLGNSFGNDPRLIREDGDRVYCFHPFANVDSLLYDFSLQPGDTTRTYNDWGVTFYAVVDSVSTIQILNQDRKCIYLQMISSKAVFNQVNFGLEDQSQVVWIEGIGSSDGLFVPYGGYTIADGISFLSCFKENDTLKYGDDCNLMYPVFDGISTSLKPFSISPNPANSTVKIGLNGIPLSHITIYSMNGKQALPEIHSPSSSNVTLDVSSLRSGIYCIILGGEQNIQVRKLSIVH